MQRLRILAVLLVALVVTTGLPSDWMCGDRTLQLLWKSGFSPPSLVRMSGEGTARDITPRPMPNGFDRVRILQELQTARRLRLPFPLQHSY